MKSRHTILKEESKLCLRILYSWTRKLSRGRSGNWSAAVGKKRWPTATFPANTGRASTPTMWSSGWTARSAAGRVWWGRSRTETPSWCWSARDCVMWLAPSGATRSTWIWSTWGGFGRHLCCRVTSFSRSLQIFLRNYFDTTILLRNYLDTTEIYDMCFTYVLT